MDRRDCLKQLGGLALATLPGLTFAAPAFKAGEHYTLVQPPQPTPSDKVEVLEFFSYGCPHCHHLDGALARWVNGLPKDVTFRRIPVTFNREPWANMGKLYYTLEALGQLPRLHGAAFEALHTQRVNLGNESTALEWLAKNGVDARKASETWRSFSVISAMQRAQQLSAAYRVDGVPMLAIGGRYVATVSMAGDENALFAVADSLIAQARGNKR